jgi:ABC-type multidrug transport system fused ATPase/permease subunit
MKRLRIFLNASPFGRSFQILEKKDLRKITLITIIQAMLGVLDLLGVIAIGLLGALSINDRQERQSKNFTSQALDFLNLSNLSFQNQSLCLGLGAVILLVGRTILSIFFTRRILFFLGVQGARISANLVSRLLSQPLLKIQSKSLQSTLYAVGDGVSIVTLQVIAASVILIADLSLLIIMVFGLAFVSPFTTISMVMIFALVGIFLHKFMDVRAVSLGQKNYKTSIEANEKISEALSLFRELAVRNRRNYYARQIASLRLSQAATRAELSFMPYLSKYVIETSVVVGALIIGLSQFFTGDTDQAVVTLAIFLAAGSRLAPAVLRVQQGSIIIRTALAQAEPTLQLIETLSKSTPLEDVTDEIDLVHTGFKPQIEFQNVTLTYPGNPGRALSEISLLLPAGGFVAIVGPSGAGKTSLIDLMLGLLKPDTGSVLISGLSPASAISSWPGAIAYVPQDIMIASGTIRENISLGYPSNLATDELIYSSVKVSQLDDFISRLEHGIDMHVGEAGSKLSGGERQRLGVARAMFTKPRLLVLDEATSALDTETEYSLGQAINSLRGESTIVMIAHRLSTVRNADLVVYMDSGKILATGTFSEVRSAVSEFDQQATRMGF